LKPRQKPVRSVRGGKITGPPSRPGGWEGVAPKREKRLRTSQNGTDGPPKGHAGLQGVGCEEKAWGPSGGGKNPGDPHLLHRGTCRPPFCGRRAIRGLFVKKKKIPKKPDRGGRSFFRELLGKKKHCGASETAEPLPKKNEWKG